LSEFYEMTEYEFNLIRGGYQKRQISEWEKTRFVAWMIQVTQVEKPLSIEEVLPLPTDKARKEQKGKLKPSKKVTKKFFDDISSRLGLNIPE